ncbi:MAG TPA: hypothetical protein VI636_04860 [Candidatus Angelobacter sp.]
MLAASSWLLAKPKINVNTLYRRGRRGNLAKQVQRCYNPRQMKEKEVLAASSWLLAKPKININTLPTAEDAEGTLLSGATPLQPTPIEEKQVLAASLLAAG